MTEDTSGKTLTVITEGRTYSSIIGAVRASASIEIRISSLTQPIGETGVPNRTAQISVLSGLADPVLCKG